MERKEMFHPKKQKIMTYVVFMIYVLLLIWLILFKFSTSIMELDHIRNINLIPFKGSMVVNGRLGITEIIYNVLVFVPFGVYVEVLKCDWSFVKKILPGFLLSFIFETLQFVFAIGASDITDVIGNTLGGTIGILFFLLIQKIFKKHSLNIVNIIGMIIEILAIAMLALLLISNDL